MQRLSRAITLSAQVPELSGTMPRYVLWGLLGQARRVDMADTALQGTASSRPAGSMTIIHKADKRKGAAPARAAAPEMDRMVANCLCCGKIYDCRESSSNDVKMFVGERPATSTLPCHKLRMQQLCTWGAHLSTCIDI